MDSEHPRGLRQVAIAVGKDALNVFPFNTGERLCCRFGRLCRESIERRHNLVRVNGNEPKRIALSDCSKFEGLTQLSRSSILDRASC